MLCPELVSEGDFSSQLYTGREHGSELLLLLLLSLLQGDPVSYSPTGWSHLCVQEMCLRDPWSSIHIGDVLGYPLS